MTITIIRGRAKRYHIGIIEGAESEYTPAEGDVITLTVKKSVNDDEPLIVKTGQDNLFEPEDTAQLEPDMYVYDVVLQLVNGEPYTIIPPPCSGKAYADFKVLRGVRDE